MNLNSDFESALTSVVPVPCPVDSLDVMFQAGVEQERLKRKNLNHSFRIVTVACVLLLFSTCGLAFWNSELTSRNLELAKAQTLPSPQKDLATQDNSENADVNHAPIPNDGVPNTLQEFIGAELAQTDEKSKRLADKTLASQPVKVSDPGETDAKSRFYLDSVFSRSSGKSFERMMMRGVMLNDEEVDRETEFVKTELATADGNHNNANHNNVKSKPTANLPYMMLRDQITQGGFGL